MSKHLIKIASMPHIALSVEHSGKDGQYCEAGENVRVRWMPSEGWGLQSAYYEDSEGEVGYVDLPSGIFEMPDDDIILYGIARKFKVGDFTLGSIDQIDTVNANVIVQGENGTPTTATTDQVASVILEGENDIVDAVSVVNSNPFTTFEAVAAADLPSTLTADDAGKIAWDTTNTKYVYWDGSAWKDL